MAKSSISSEDASQTQHAECSPNNSIADKSTKLKKLEDWTKENVRHWLINVIKVPQQYADILYKEDVYGASLILFDKQDFLDAGLKHGPAVQILKNMLQFKTSFDVLNNSDILTVTASLRETTTARRPTNGSNDLDIPPELSVQENQDGILSVQPWSLSIEDTSKYTCNEGKTLQDTSSFQEEKDQKEGGARSTNLPLTHSTNSESSVIHLCTPRPFDKRFSTFEYTQNEFLPPETGPSNLTDPVHEYKLLTDTKNASEDDVLKKFTNEVFWFAAGCINTRTNGTIHFGVGDEPLYPHGQIIGLEVISQKKFIDAFDTKLKEHFTNNTSIAKICIRPPQFFKVKCPDNIGVDKWVIEVDVVPMYDLTGEKWFYTAIDKKGRKSKCIFIRDGASTNNSTPEKDPKKTKQTKKNLKDVVKLWALFRKIAEERQRQVQARLMGGWGWDARVDPLAVIGPLCP